MKRYVAKDKSKKLLVVSDTPSVPYNTELSVPSELKVNLTLVSEEQRLRDRCSAYTFLITNASGSV